MTDTYSSMYQCEIIGMYECGIKKWLYIPHSLNTSSGAQIDL